MPTEFGKHYSGIESIRKDMILTDTHFFERVNEQETEFMSPSNSSGAKHLVYVSHPSKQ